MKYRVIFWRKEVLGEFHVIAKDETEAEKEAFWQLHKFDRDNYDDCDIEEVEDDEDTED